MSGITKKMYKSRLYLLQQLKQLGYNTDDYDEFSINEVHIMNENKQMDMLLENENNEKIYVKYYTHSGIRPQNIYDMIDDIFHMEQKLTTKDCLTIIAKDPPNDTLTNLLQQIYADDGIYIVIISIAQLQFNLLEHDMVPKHSRMTEEEVKEFKTKYNISNDNQIPEISRFDPVAQAIGLRPNEYCKIVRSSKTAINGNYYRVCVNY